MRRKTDRKLVFARPHVLSAAAVSSRLATGKGSERGHPLGTNHAAKLPERLRFLLCIFDSGEYCELAWLEGALRYRKGFVFKEKPSCQLECTPDPKHWAHFWRDLDRIGVWSWKPEYPNPDFLHGKGWQLEIARDGRTLNSKGDNGYPGPRGAGNAASSPFGQLIAALRALSGIKEIS